MINFHVQETQYLEDVRNLQLIKQHKRIISIMTHLHLIR